jgi:hypothetical protein
MTPPQSTREGANGAKPVPIPVRRISKVLSHPTESRRHGRCCGFADGR